jgi:hypothetical protein
MTWRKMAADMHLLNAEVDDSDAAEPVRSLRGARRNRGPRGGR